MARRDNQGIQIAMIVFILTTLAFMVGTYLGYSSWAAAAAERDQARADAQQKDNQMRQVGQTVDAMKLAVGIDGSQEDQAARDELTRLCKEVYGAGLPEESQNFIGIIQARDSYIATLNSDLKKANDQIRQLNDDLKQAMATQKKSIEAAEAQAALANKSWETDKTQWETDVKARKTEVDKISANLNAAETARRTALADAAKRVNAALASEEELRSQNTTYREQLNEVQRDTPDKYDGRVLASDAFTKSVIVNIGAADGVRPKTTFGVYDADDTNVRTAKKKASIEITKVLSDNTSEARVTNSRQPIVPHDNIYSPIWSPGSRMGIALVGEMDVDKDGFDDRDYIKSLIQRNGGEVDAEVVDGKIVGALDVNTRYLVVGEGVGGGDDAAVAAAKLDNQLLQNAKRLSVEQMSIDELMDLMSPPGRARAVRYSGITRRADFRPEAKRGARSSAGTTTYSPRTPTTRRFSP